MTQVPSVSSLHFLHLRPSWQRWSLIALPWLLLTLLYIPGTLYLDRDSLHPRGWLYIAPHYFVIFMIWALYTPLIDRLLKTVPIHWPPSLWASAMHCGMAALLIFVHALLLGVYNLFFPEVNDGVRYWAIVAEEIMWRGPFGLVLYTATAACLSALDTLQRYHQREQKLVQAQLDALKTQIEPHFLFNTLNAISELVYRDAAAADKTLTQLSGLLRHLLDKQAHEHRLDEEVGLLKEYVAIQQTLLGDRLLMHWKIDNGLDAAIVPTLLLQPLIENAIAHGIAQLRKGGQIHLTVTSNGSSLLITLSNDGPVLPKSSAGIEQSSPSRQGVGLSNTKARLHTLYGNQQHFKLTPVDTGGAIVTMDLPLRYANTSTKLPQSPPIPANDSGSKA